MQDIYQVSQGVKYDILAVEPELAELLQALKQKFGAVVVCMQSKLRCAETHHHILTTGLREYFDSYVATQAYKCDPVFKRCTTSNVPFEWADMEEAPITLANMPEEGRSLKWITMPVSNNRAVAALHMASSFDESTWRMNVADMIWCGMRTGDEIIRRLLALRWKDMPLVSLSSSQVDYLSLLAAGRDVCEIVNITKNDFKVVNRSISDAMNKLNARTHSQAVAKAMFHGILPLSA